MTSVPVSRIAVRPRPGAIAPYDATAIPWHKKAMLDKSKILLFTGSKGGGKSRCAAEKIHAFCLKYPGAQGLIVRKTRETMTNSTVLFMQTVIIGNDPRVQYFEGKHRFEYKHNGSFLAYGGMKDEEQREQVRSIGSQGGVDFIWMEESNAFIERDFQELLGCLRGTAAPWRQIILTTNPDGPDHWIRRRMIVGKEASVYYSSALDNPFNPPDYQDTLNLMTGIDYQRLVLGQWVQAEGVIFDNFDPDGNVMPLTYSPSRPLLWGIDDGYAEGKGPGSESYHPRVFLAGQDDGLGGFNVFCERYRTGESNYQESISAFSEICRDKGLPSFPDVCYVDSSSGVLRGALSVAGLPFFKATHDVVEGIRNLRRLMCDGKGVRLFHVDPSCVNLIREFQMCRYQEEGNIAGGGDRKPMKVDDHGVDACRYLTYRLRIEQ